MEICRYSVFKQIDPHTIHIKVPKKRVEIGLFVYGGVFASFTLFLIFISITNRLPLPVMLFALAPLILATTTFGLYMKWFRAGQFVEVDKLQNRIILKEKLANLLPREKKIDIKDIDDFWVKPYVAYSSGNYPSSPVTKGFCVKVKFVKKKLFWFIEKDTPYVTIGAYLTKEEAMALKEWLKEQCGKED